MEGILVIAIIYWVFSMIAKAGKGKKRAAQKDAQPAQPAAQRANPTIQLHRPAPSMHRHEEKRSAQRDFRAPEAPCIVCENTGEDHFQRDKARRIAQLDDWLKNGLIDRDEYRVMKDRYQRGI